MAKPTRLTPLRHGEGPWYETDNRRWGYNQARDVQQTHGHCRTPGAPGLEPGKGVNSGNYYKLPQIGRMGAIEELS